MPAPAPVPAPAPAAAPAPPAAPLAPRPAPATLALTFGAMAVSAFSVETDFRRLDGGAYVGAPAERVYMYPAVPVGGRSADFASVVDWVRRTAMSCVGDGDSRMPGLVDEVNVFSAAAASGGQRSAIVLCAGPQHDGSIAEHLRSMGILVLEVDVLIGGRLHDLTDHSAHGIVLPLLRSAAHGDWIASHSSPPCATWSVARADGYQMRTIYHPWGVPGLPADMAEQCRVANALLTLVFDFSRLVVESGGQATIEQPSDRCNPDEPRTYWPEKARQGHANVFMRPEASVFMRSEGDFALDMVREYATAVGATLITTPLCAFGAPWQKYVSVLASPGAAAVLAPAHEFTCAHGWHEAHAHGFIQAALSGQYPSAFCFLLACAMICAQHAPAVHDGESPIVVAGSMAALAAGSRVAATTAPGYEEADPGWWGAEEDLSDEEGDEHDALIGSVVSTYKACVKTKVKYAADDDGQLRRHSVPNSYTEAMCHESAAELWRAMLTEMNAQEDCGTWEQRPAAECYDAGRAPIGCRWVYDCKIDNSTRKMLLWKARLVARGDQMVYMRDFFETYAGVCRMSTFRIFLALAALWGLVLTAADVSTAYLHAPLRDCEVWMRPPEGFEQLGRLPDGRPALLRLRMALYGLRQSAREWAITLRGWLLEWRYEGQPTFCRLDSDPYVFIWRTARGIVLILLWVDDIFIGHSCVGMRAAFMAAFMSRFRVKDLGQLTQGLGMDIVQDLEARTVSVSQERYILDATRRFDVHVENAWADIPVPAPLAKACRDACPADVEREQYADSCRIMGGIIVHVASTTRPDVAVGAQIVSSAPPSAARHALSRRILGYLARTAALRITYRGDASSELQLAFSSMGGDDGDGGRRAAQPWMAVDADHATDKSCTGWLFFLAGAAVAWAVRAQPLPSLSSTEAELYGLSTAVCDLLIVVNFLEEVGFDVSTAVPIFCDSRGARLLVADCAAPARTRHIHRRWYFIRYYKDANRLKVTEIKGANNPANFMTKPVGGAAFARDRSRAMGMR